MAGSPGAAEFYTLYGRALQSLAADFFELTQAADENRARETSAAIKIQCAFRGSVVRARYNAVLRSCGMIQRLIRGRLGRIRAAAKEVERARRWNMLFFDHCAEVIQKFFRGAWSRKYLHDFYARRRYLDGVASRGDRTVTFLKKAQETQHAQQQAAEEAQMRKEFDVLCGQLHHLVSTTQIPGVYNPPYSDTLPKAFEKPVETHLRDSCRVRLPRSLRRPPLSSHPASSPNPDGTLHKSYGGSTRQEIEATTAGPPQMPAPVGGSPKTQRTPLVSRTANVGRLQKLQGPFRSKEQIEISNARAYNLQRTLQSQPVYDAVEKDRKMHERLSKLTRVSPEDFVSKKPPNSLRAIPSVNAETKYLDRPIEFRSEYTELPKIKDKPPFYTALGHDRMFSEYDEGQLLSHGVV